MTTKDHIEELKAKLEGLDSKIDKAVGKDIKPIHYAILALVLIGIISNWIN